MMSNASLYLFALSNSFIYFALSISSAHVASFLLIFYLLSTLPFPIHTYAYPIPLLLVLLFHGNSNILRNISHCLFSPCFLSPFLYCKLHIYLTLSFRFTLQFITN